jgi:hypothetical protein
MRDLDASFWQPARVRRRGALSAANSSRTLEGRPRAVLREPRATIS